MDYTIIDAHSHLWLNQDTIVNGLPVRTIDRGRSIFLGEERQMLPPFMIDGRNSAEVFLSNMDYAQVSAAVVTQEFIDGNQNEYLADVVKRYPDRFFVFGMCEFRKPGFLPDAKELIAHGFRGLATSARRRPGLAQLSRNDGDVQVHGEARHNIVDNTGRRSIASARNGRGHQRMSRS